MNLQTFYFIQYLLSSIIILLLSSIDVIVHMTIEVLKDGANFWKRLILSEHNGGATKHFFGINSSLGYIMFEQYVSTSEMFKKDIDNIYTCDWQKVSSQFCKLHRISIGFTIRRMKKLKGYANWINRIDD